MLADIMSVNTGSADSLFNSSSSIHIEAKLSDNINIGTRTLYDCFQGFDS